MNNNTFDTIEVHRPELAQTYLDLLAAQPGRPLALFAPRRVGKTFFLDHDLTPTAVKAGILAVYADLWLYRTAPLAALNHALEEALDTVTVPENPVGKIARTKVKGLNIFGAGITLGEEPALHALPETPELRLDALTARLTNVHDGKILLMLDEAQTLADAPSSLIATLRAVLHRRQDRVLAVFTGSSQEGLANLMLTTGAPMYQFTQLVTFPALGDEYLTLLAAHFAWIHSGKKLNLDGLRQLFAKIGFKPALLRDIVKSMSAEGMTDIEAGLRHYVSDRRQTIGWQGLLQTLTGFDRQVLIALGQGMSPFGKQTLEWLGASAGSKATIAKVRTSIGKCTKMGIIGKSDGTLRFDDPLLAEFLAQEK